MKITRRTALLSFPALVAGIKAALADKPADEFAKQFDIDANVVCSPCINPMTGKEFVHGVVLYPEPGMGWVTYESRGRWRYSGKTLSTAITGLSDGKYRYVNNVDCTTILEMKDGRFTIDGYEIRRGSDVVSWKHLPWLDSTTLSVD